VLGLLDLYKSGTWGSSDDDPTHNVAHEEKTNAHEQRTEGGRDQGTERFSGLNQRREHETEYRSEGRRPAKHPRKLKHTDKEWGRQMRLNTGLKAGDLPGVRKEG
jgi:hypothetical protein